MLGKQHSYYAATSVVVFSMEPQVSRQRIAPSLLTQLVLKNYFPMSRGGLTDAERQLEYEDYGEFWNNLRSARPSNTYQALTGRKYVPNPAASIMGVMPTKDARQVNQATKRHPTYTKALADGNRNLGIYRKTTNPNQEPLTLLDALNNNLITSDSLLAQAAIGADSIERSPNAPSLELAARMANIYNNASPGSPPWEEARQWLNSYSPTRYDAKLGDVVGTNVVPITKGQSLPDIAKMDAGTSNYNKIRGADAIIQRLNEQNTLDSLVRGVNGDENIVAAIKQLQGADIEHLMNEVNLNSVNPRTGASLGNANGMPYTKKKNHEWNVGHDVSGVDKYEAGISTGYYDPLQRGESTKYDSALGKYRPMTEEEQKSYDWDISRRIAKGKDEPLVAMEYVDPYTGEVTPYTDNEVLAAQQGLRDRYMKLVSPEYGSRPSANPALPLLKSYKKDKALYRQVQAGEVWLTARERAELKNRLWETQTALKEIEDAGVALNIKDPGVEAAYRDSAGVLGEPTKGGVAERIQAQPRVGYFAEDGSRRSLNAAYRDAGGSTWRSNPDLNLTPEQSAEAAQNRKMSNLMGVNPNQVLADLAFNSGGQLANDVEIDVVTPPLLTAKQIENQIKADKRSDITQREAERMWNTANRRVRNDYSSVPKNTPDNAQTELGIINDAIVRINQQAKALASKDLNDPLLFQLQANYVDLRRREKALVNDAYLRAYTPEGVDRTPVFEYSDLEFDPERYNQVVNQKVSQEDLSRFSQQDTGVITKTDEMVTGTPISLPYQLLPGDTEKMIPGAISDGGVKIFEPDNVVSYLGEEGFFGYGADEGARSVMHYLENLNDELSRTKSQIDNIVKTEPRYESNPGTLAIKEQLEKRVEALEVNKEILVKQLGTRSMMTDLAEGETDLTNALRTRRVRALMQLDNDRQGYVPPAEMLPSVEEARQSSTVNQQIALRNAKQELRAVNPATQRPLPQGDGLSDKALRWETANQAAINEWYDLVDRGGVPELKEYEVLIEGMNSQLADAIQKNARPETIKRLEGAKASLQNEYYAKENQLRDLFVTAKRGRRLNPVEVDNAPRGVLSERSINRIETALDAGGDTIARPQAVPPSLQKFQHKDWVNPRAIEMMGAPVFGQLQDEIARQYQARDLAIDNYVATNQTKDKSGWNQSMINNARNTAASVLDEKLKEGEAARARIPVIESVPEGRLPIPDVPPSTGDNVNTLMNNVFRSDSMLYNTSNIPKGKSQWAYTVEGPAALPTRRPTLSRGVVNTPGANPAERGMGLHPNNRKTMAAINAAIDELNSRDSVLGKGLYYAESPSVVNASPAPSAVFSLAPDAIETVVSQTPNIDGEQFLDELNASRRVYQEPSVVTMVRDSLPDPRRSDLLSPSAAVASDAIETVVEAPTKGWGAIPRSWRTAAIVAAPVAIGGYLLAQQQERARQEEEAYLRNMMMEGMSSPY